MLSCPERPLSVELPQLADVRLVSKRRRWMGRGEKSPPSRRHQDGYLNPIIRTSLLLYFHLMRSVVDGHGDRDPPIL